MRIIDGFCVSINEGATGKNIEMLVKENQCTAREIQEMLHLQSVQSIYRWYHGQLPSIDNLVCLSRIFEVPIEKILITNDENDFSTSTVIHIKLKDFLLMSEL